MLRQMVTKAAGLPEANQHPCSRSHGVGEGHWVPVSVLILSIPIPKGNTLSKPLRSAAAVHLYPVNKVGRRQLANHPCLSL